MKMDFIYGDKVIVNLDDDYIPRIGESIVFNGERYKVQDIENVATHSLYIEKVNITLSRILKMSEVF